MRSVGLGTWRPRFFGMWAKNVSPLRDGVGVGGWRLGKVRAHRVPCLNPDLEDPGEILRMMMKGRCACFHHPENGDKKSRKSGFRQRFRYG